MTAPAGDTADPPGAGLDPLAVAADLLQRALGRAGEKIGSGTLAARDLAVAAAALTVGMELREANAIARGAVPSDRGPRIVVPR